MQCALRKSGVAASRVRLSSISAGWKKKKEKKEKQVSHCGPNKEMWEGEIKMPCMQDAGCLTRPDPGFFLFSFFLFFLRFADHCNTLCCNSISIFLLHFKVAENNTLNGKMKYVSSPACYLSALPPSSLLPLSLPPSLPAYMHTSFNSNRKSKWRERGKVPGWSVFPVFPLK